MAGRVSSYSVDYLHFETFRPAPHVRSRGDVEHQTAARRHYPGRGHLGRQIDPRDHADAATVKSKHFSWWLYGCT